MHSEVDLKEFFVLNHQSILKEIRPEVVEVWHSREWFKKNDILDAFEEAFADFVEYKIRWSVVDNLNASFEDTASVIDKAFIVDVISQDVLKSGYWL